ncbi:hypothetical protein F2Q70_00012761 [Brassica cretica]|uniref:Uncharacterized protein n=1 Tax=Brassica cretica TaxID=69181 RepID=A0A8S9MDM5_BRACR|nr:hypothetical protein F2Q68_00005837 [Brassica cretica]KAF2615346.1 hypothetical protein F2Q70_00012761 [Brassica cretica]
MTPAAGHDSPKLQLQWIGRNRHWAATSTKHSNPIAKRINRKTAGAENAGPTAESSEPRKSNSIHHEDLPPSEPATKGQHSYAINNSPQNKSSTYYLGKYCAFHDRKGLSTEECRVAIRSQNKTKKTSEETGEEYEEPSTPKSNRKVKVSSNKRSREIEPESPSSPPPTPKKRVDMISWGPNSNATNEIESQNEGEICVEIMVAIRALETPMKLPLLLASLSTTQARNFPLEKSSTSSESTR